jgi:hypothetical protein
VLSLATAFFFHLHLLRKGLARPANPSVNDLPPFDSRSPYPKPSLPNAPQELSQDRPRPLKPDLLAAPAAKVTGLMNDLLRWLKNTDAHR